MLSNYSIVGFVLTKDAAGARAFYEKTLGLEFESEDNFGMGFLSKDTLIRIAKVPSFTPAQHTVLGWNVTAIADVVKEMTERGVVFERFPWMPADAGFIWNAPDGSQVAWFKDPDGNTLSLSEHPKHTADGNA